jgi:hypothetical protein
MSYRIATIITTGFVLAACTRAVTSALPESRPAGNIDIVVDGSAQPLYAHDGRWYVEARKGREYAIRLHNPYPVRVAVALSVDGLNTIDARETTASDARKWVVAPFQTITISGWQTSLLEARRFEFTTEAGSYGQALGKTANLGVISAVFFKERVRTFPLGAEKEDARPAPQARSSAPAAAPAEQGAPAAAGGERKTDNDYAATGMGRRTDHAVTQVFLDLEDAPVQTVDIRYEFHPQLVKLGILPAAPTSDPLQRREHAHGFAPAFCPEPPRQR